MNVNTNEFSDVLKLILWLNKNNGNVNFEKLPMPRLRYFEISEEYNLTSSREIVEKYLSILVLEYEREGNLETFCKSLLNLNDWQMFAEKLFLYPSVDDTKLKFINSIKNPIAKAEIIATLKNEHSKRKYLKSFSRDEEKAIIIASFSNDEDKLEMLDSLKSDFAKAIIVRSLESDEKKKEYIISGKAHRGVVADIIASMKSDEVKEELLPLVASDTARFRVVVSVNDSEKKKSLFETEIRDERVRKRKFPELIMSLPKIEQFQYFMSVDDSYKFLILRDCNLPTQLEFVDLIDDERIRNRVMSEIDLQEVISYVGACPKDDKEHTQESVSKIIRYSQIEPVQKIALMHAFIKDKELSRSLLSTLDLDVVMKEYFHFSNTRIPISMLELVDQSYSIYDKAGVNISIDGDFDLENEENKKLVQKINQMESPTVFFSSVNYSEFQRFQEVFEEGEAALIVQTINLTGTDLSIGELEEIAGNVVFFRLGDEKIVATEDYIKAKKILDEIYPHEESEMIASIRSDLEVAVSSLQVGNTLKNAKMLFESIGMGEEEQREYGSVLLKTIYEKSLKNEFELALDEESVTILHDWDLDRTILANDLDKIAPKITKSGMKRAISLAFENGEISESKAAEFVVYGLTSRMFNDEGSNLSARIVIELIKKQGLRIEDIEVMDPGSYADVLAIGKYVLKIGEPRETAEVPEHDRILEPLLKMEVFNSEFESYATNFLSTFIEVQPRITHFEDLEDIDEEEKNQQLYELYRELRESRIVWGDTAKRNVGILEFLDVDEVDILSGIRDEFSQSRNVTFYRSKKMHPKEGEKRRLVILDTDFIYQLSEENRVTRDNLELSVIPESQDLIDPLLAIPSAVSTEFEKRYQREQTMRRMKEIQKRKEEARKKSEKPSYGE